MPIAEGRVTGGRLPLVALALIVAATVFRPGDAPWISDEPMLLNGAIYMNSIPGHFLGIPLPFMPAPYGLIGTRGARYGPLAVWIDQVFLAFTHNPVVMIAIRAAVVAAINALALYWLAKSLRVTAWIAVAVMLSPWLYLYSRQLWDNSLCVPLSAMTLAAYADFIATHRAWSLRLAIFCGMILLLVHLMVIPLLAAIGLHLAIVEHRLLWRLKWSLLAIVVIVTAASWPYWWDLMHHFHKDIPGGTSAWRGYFFPLDGAHHLTAIGLENIFGSAWPAMSSPVVLVARWISLAGFGAVWVGMILAIPRVWRVVRFLPGAGPIDHIFTVAWAAVIFQSALDGLQHVYEGPHYLNATWIVFAAFLFLPARYAPKWVIAIYAVSLLTVTAMIAITIHENGGARSDNYGTTVSSQIDAVREIQKFSRDSRIEMEIPEWTAHHYGIDTLLELYPPPATDRPRGRILIHYGDASRNDAHIVVTAY